jgi:hypothetical protein
MSAAEMQLTLPLDHPALVYIYALLDEETRQIRYVGYSADPARRVRGHWKDRGKVAARNSRHSAWLCSLSGPPGYFILQVVPWDQRHAVEKHWTDLFRQVPGADLLNICSGATPSDELRAKIGAGLKRTYLSPEYHAKLSAARTGKPRPGHGEKVRAALKGQKRAPLSPEHRAKIRASVLRRISERAAA